MWSNSMEQNWPCKISQYLAYIYLQMLSLIDKLRFANNMVIILTSYTQNTLCHFKSAGLTLDKNGTLTRAWLPLSI